MSDMAWLTNYEKNNPKVDEVETDFSQSNIAGIPWFVINDNYAISGAQLPEVFVQIFDLVRQDSLSGPFSN